MIIFASGTKNRNFMTSFLAVDLGATSGRTVLASFDGERVEMQEFTRFNNPQVPLMGHVYWDLPHLYNEILKALRQLASQGITIESIGIDTWGCDFAFFGAKGQLLGLPFCYRDAHTDGAIEQYTREVMPAEALYRRTGIQFMPFNSLFQFYTLQREGLLPKDASKVMFIPDALSYLLTGHCVCEYTVASTSQLINVSTGDLDPELLASVGLSREQFGPLVMPGTPIGTLTPEVQQATGMGAVKVVAVAGHDTASAVLGIPATAPDYAYLSCGTWSLLGIESAQPIVSDESRRMNFTNEGGAEGNIRFLKNICGLWLFERCRAEWPDAPQDVAALAALWAESHYDGLINPDDPAFAHPQSMTAAIAAYCEAHHQAAPQSKADFIRCIFRSLAARYAEVIEWLRTVSPTPIKWLHVIGGGSRNAHLMQLTAKATGLPVVAGPAEGTALGNILMQLRAAGQAPTFAIQREIAARSVKTTLYK